MKLLLQELGKYKKLLWGALALATVNQTASLMDPQIIRIIVDNYAIRANELAAGEFLRGVGLLLALGVGLAFISRTAKAFQNYYVSVITQRSGTNLYARSVTHAFSLPYAVFEDQRSGDLLNRMQKARTDSQLFITNFVNIFFLSAVSVVFVLVYAYYVYWVIGLIFTVLLPIMAFAIYFLSKKIKDAQQAIVKETASLSGSTTETLRNVELVKSLGLESQEVDRLNKVNERILELELYKTRLVRKLDFIQGTLMNALNSGIFFFVLWLIFIETISFGQFLTFWFYSFWIFQPLYMLGTLVTSYQETKASLGQLEEVLALEPVKAPTNPQSIGPIERIEYKNVTLKYGDMPTPAVQNIDLKIDSGETVAFVGPSGSGKSTMIKLLAGLYNPTEGTLLFNNISAQDIDTDELRKRIGLVAQETQLFAGTIRENLLFVRPEATDAECVRALELAQAKQIFEREGAKGLDTKIGEGGVKLSGGERQRLAIARALLRAPDLLVFDEATSSLDSITEHAITQTIKIVGEAHEGLIKIIVAHRLSTVVHADKIYVFEKGQIVETGTHDSLVSQGGLYAALWREQIAGEK